MSRIVATIISDSRQALIRDAIQSIAEWVDRVLLVDTGITDNTKEIARALLGERLVVEPYRWMNDFAAVRNFALQAAARHGATWALTLDTDERLGFSGIASRDDLAARLNTKPDLRAWLVLSADGSYSKERFIYVGPDRPTLTWIGRTHEYLAGAQENERAILKGVTVSEIRKTAEEFRGKLLRDLAILEEETQKRPQETRWWYYLGQTFEGLGRFAEAADAYRRCAAARMDWAEQSAWACYRAANCCLQLDRPDEALELCALGLARQPESPELAWLAGYVCYRLRRFRQAVTWSQLSVTLGSFRGSQSGQRRIGFRFLPAWYESPYDVLRFAYHELGQPGPAAESELHFVEAKKQRLAEWGGIAGPCDRNPSQASSGGGPRRDDPAGEERIGDIPKEAGFAIAGHRPVRVAVLGLYSSGSTATAAMLHRLGVTLGRDVTLEYHYEPRWLAAQLRQWWNEPELVEAIPRHQRVGALREWMATMERGHSQCVGAKHPLLTLCGPDLAEAWGRETKFIWTWRPVEESIASLRRRGWWPGKEETIQRRLWAAANEFFSARPHWHVSFDDVLNDPAREVERLIDFLGLSVSSAQRAAAAAAVQKRLPAGA